ncbi:MAG: hypothetical protein IJ328_03640 [Muribaculaceae bacterium]|nr:hypothetical protein [Muribaculaceae bacterium]
MSKLHITGISRGSEYSPNNVGSDSEIFNNVVNALTELGCDVDIYSEKEFVEKNIQAEIIFDMARDKATIKRLQELEDGGALVINSAYGIMNCVRKPMTELLLKNNVPHPHTVIIDTKEEFCGDFYPCWIKRGNSHTILKEDVTYVTCKEEAETALADFRNRNISTAVISEHLEGDLIKFYGVQDTDFFYWFYPSHVHSKFGLEKINGDSQGYNFDVNELKRISDLAAVALNTPVYGGDCVVSKDGTVRLIDFNDWPSFARCREEAGKKIAECIYNRAKNHKKQQ